MQRWEYCAVGPIKGSVSGEFGYYPHLWQFTLSGLVKTPIAAKEGVSESEAVAQVIAQLGDDGWEMVGAGPVEGGYQYYNYHIIYFKRAR